MCETKGLKRRLLEQDLSCQNTVHGNRFRLRGGPHLFSTKHSIFPVTIRYTILQRLCNPTIVWDLYSAIPTRRRTTRTVLTIVVLQYCVPVYGLRCDKNTCLPIFVPNPYSICVCVPVNCSQKRKRV